MSGHALDTVAESRSGWSGLDLGAAELRARVEARPADAPAVGWFIVVTDYDGFANLHGPYWETDRLVEKYESLSLVAHWNVTAQIHVIPIEGIKPA